MSEAVNNGTGAARVAVVIEDDLDIRELITTVLQQSGFEVHAAADGLWGIEAVQRHAPDIVTIDLGLPGIDGFEVVRRIRLESDCYIVMVSARTDEAETLMALNAGADDYVTKPFRPRELRARITAMMRRPRAGATDAGDAPHTNGKAPAEPLLEASPRLSNSASSNGSAAQPGAPVTLGDLQLDPDTRTVHLSSHEVELTRTEFELLHTLMQTGRRVRTKADLVRHLRADDSAASAAYVSEADERAVEVHIGNLRRKLSNGAQNPAAPAWIETVRGVGYRVAAMAQ